ncbi:MAG TPA: DUF559 domain-containing protein [Solirubrobacterales bacterium]|nr:DUF559 domain-containing protein [Solirubrobacterales bacterium]
MGWPHLDRRRRWAAAVLAAAAGDQATLSPTQPYFGNGAVLSHRSAAALLGVGKERSERVDLIVRRREVRQRPGLHVRGRPSLASSEIRLVDGLPVTSPVQTLIDLATELGPIAIERAVNDADKRDLIDPETLRLALDDHAGEPGVRPLRQILDRLTFRLSDSDLEIYFRPIAAAVGLPSPLSKQKVNRFEVDFFWPSLGLVVETDGLRYHRTPSAQARDARRDRAHILAGMTPLRFTHYEIRYEPHRVREALARALAMLQKRFRH